MTRPPKTEGKPAQRRAQHILCLADASNEESRRSGQGLVADLRAAGHTVSDEIDASGANDLGADPHSVLLLLGGDGFLLETLQTLDYPPTPVLGVNFGSVGFLMNKRSCLPKLVDMIGFWRFLQEEHVVLEATVTLEDGSQKSVRALNDFVIERMSGQSIRLRLYLDDNLFNIFSGDGLVLATAAGSTAYNLAAGGPVLHPDIEGMVVTPLYPHRALPFHSLQFPLVVPSTAQLKIEGDDLPKRGMRVLADGRPTSHVARIEIGDSRRRAHLLRIEDHLFVRTLSRKFMGETEEGS